MVVALSVELIAACSTIRGTDEEAADAVAAAAAAAVAAAAVGIPPPVAAAHAAAGAPPYSHDADLKGSRTWCGIMHRWYGACVSPDKVTSSDVTGPHADAQLGILLSCVNEMDDLIARGIVINPPRQFILEFRQVCHGMLLLARLLVRPEHGLYVILKRFTQTVLEQWFGRMRGTGDAGLGGPTLNAAQYADRRAGLTAAGVNSGMQVGGSYRRKVQRARRRGEAAPSRYTAGGRPAYVPDGGIAVVLPSGQSLPLNIEGGQRRTLTGALAFSGK
jgi:hypothetical protein